MAQAVLGAAAQIPELKAAFSGTGVAQASAASIQVFCLVAQHKRSRQGDLIPMFDDFPVVEAEEVKIVHADLLS